MLMLSNAKNRFNYCTCGKSPHKIEDVIIFFPFVMYKQLLEREKKIFCPLGFDLIVVFH